VFLAERRGEPYTGRRRIISPVLANIFLHDLDVAMEAHGIAWVRYADDVVALCRSREEAEQGLGADRSGTQRVGIEA
jgi:retron-type reverse transcriptase